jgi:hypothetical protein
MTVKRVPAKISSIFILAVVTLAGLSWVGSAAAIPASYTGDCPDCIGVIGDSLTYQNGSGIANIKDRLMAAGWQSDKIRVDGIIGRPIAGDFSGKPGAVTTINSWKAGGFDPKTYVILLGTNNKNATSTLWTTEINKDLNAIGPGHTIIWMDLGFKNESDSRVLNFNANLAAIAGQRSDMFIAKSSSGLGWNEWIHTHPNQSGLWLATDPDGVHMTTAGYTLRNQFIGEALMPYAPPTDPEPQPIEYITNGSVEVNLTGWGGVSSSASQVSRSAEAAYEGTMSVKTANKTSSTASTVGFGTTANNGGQHWVTNTVAGQLYSARVWVKAGAAGQTLKLYVKEQRSDASAPVNPSATRAWTATDTEWHLLTLTYPAKEADNSLLYRVWMDSAAPGSYFYADAMSLSTH